MSANPKLARPLVTVGTHPIETGRYVIATPAVCTLHDTVKQWLSNRAPGGMIYGKQRFGKTRAIKYLMDQLPGDLGPLIPIFSLSARDYRLPTETTFFEDLLRAVGHAFTGGKTAVKRDRLVEYLYERATEGRRNRLVIVIDEAQKLHEMHYRWLVDLHNELDGRGVTTTWLLVGQEELVHQREVFVTAKKMQIIGRFMVHHFRFSGLESVEDVKQSLNCYDDCELTEHPVGSGWSFTRYYFPAAFDCGWRLATQAETLWEVFNKVRVEQKLPGKAEVPMQYFAGTVEYALRTFSSLKDEPGDISAAMWKEAILSSGYHDAAQYL
jgi:hypothetical protein